MSTAVSAGAYLHHLQLQSSDPARLAEFYGDAMDMKLERLGGDKWICEGPLRRMLFVRGRNKKLGYAGFACRDTGGVAAIRARAEEGSIQILSSPSPLFG